MKNLVGKVALCSINKIGVIEGTKELPWGKSYVGVCLEDGSPWASRNPRILFDSLEEYERDRKVLGIGKEYRDDDYERWSMDKAFMSMAFCIAKCSHDSNTQHGAVIVDANNHVVATGFNGWLPHSPDNMMPNKREGGYKYNHVRHAERNAINQSTKANLSDCRLYVTGYPCNDCLSDIAARGIKRIIIGDKTHVRPEGYWEMHNFVTRSQGIEVVKYEGEIVDTFKMRVMRHVL